MISVHLFPYCTTRGLLLSLLNAVLASPAHHNAISVNYSYFAFETGNAVLQIKCFMAVTKVHTGHVAAMSKQHGSNVLCSSGIITNGKRDCLTKSTN